MSSETTSLRLRSKAASLLGIPVFSSHPKAITIVAITIVLFKDVCTYICIEK